MSFIAQYCDGHPKDGKYLVRFAVWREEDGPTSPKVTVVVDATDCTSLPEIEQKAFDYFRTTDEGHTLKDEVGKACQEGRQVKPQPVVAPSPVKKAKAEPDKPPENPADKSPETTSDKPPA